LARLNEIFCSSRGAVISAVAGMGGIGKTQLAAKYATDYQQNFPGGVCWLNGRTGDLSTQIVVKAEFDLQLKGLDAAKEQFVQPEALVQWCWQHWQPETGLVLVVLDDVADWAVCRAYVPTGDRFRVLVTTRQQNLLTNYETIALDVLQLQEAHSLLASLEKYRRVERDPGTAAALCRALGYLPLAIELVGCYLASDPYLTLNQVMASLHEKGMQDPALERPENYEIVAERGVRAAFELSWATLEPEAQQVARLLSYFALDWIEWDLAEQVMQVVEGEGYSFGSWKARLVNSSLVEVDPDRLGWCRLHPLIQQFLREEEARFVQTAGEAPLRSAFVSQMVAIAQQLPDNPSTKAVRWFEGVRAHIQQVVESHIETLGEGDRVWPFVALARFYEGQGLYSQAEEWRRECLCLTQRLFEGDHPDVARSLNNLAGLYQAQGRLNQAEPLYQQALAMRQRLFAGDHPAVALSLNNLAYLYQAQGRLNQAEPLYQQALAMYQRLFEGDHPAVALSLNNLAYLYDAQGRLNQAEPLFQQALAMYQRLFAGDHPAVALSLNNLAYLYRAQGRLNQAEPLYQQALAMTQHLFAGDHPDVALSLNNLAYLYQAQGRLNQAEPLFQQALAMTQHLFAGDHPDEALSLNNLASLYRAQGRLNQAEPLFQQALAMRQRLFAGDHPEVALSLNNLGAFYYEQGRWGEAETLLVQALAMWQTILGADHPNTIATQEWLTMVRQAMQGTQISRRKVLWFLRILRFIRSLLRRIWRLLYNRQF